MAFERRPDGSLVLRMHVPLAASLFVMVLFFGFGFMFAYGLVSESTTQISFRGTDLGFSLDPLVWDILFVLGALGMIGPGLFILIGLMRGSKPFVHIGSKRLELRDRPMARDAVMRWDEIADIRRFRIQHIPAIMVRSKSVQKIQLSGHTFRGKDDFETLCREIEYRASLASPSSGPGARRTASVFQG